MNTTSKQGQAEVFMFKKPTSFSCNNNLNQYNEIKLAMNIYTKQRKYKPDADLCSKTMGGIMILRNYEHGYLAAVKDGEIING